MTPRLPYEDAALPIEHRVDDLMDRLELDDKIGLLYFPYGFVADVGSSSRIGTGASGP